MRSTRQALAGILFALAAVGPSTSMAAPDVAIELSYDLASDTTSVLIIGLDDTVVTSQDWNVALPIGVSAGESSFYVPMRLLGHLRDRSDSSSHPDAAIATAWIRELMGSHAFTATSQIPIAVLAGITTEETSEWCGRIRDAAGRCIGNCEGPDVSPTTCVGCGCKGTIKIKTEPELEPELEQDGDGDGDGSGN